jgi:conjugal transfer pilus assembly protein TraW
MIKSSLAHMRCGKALLSVLVIFLTSPLAGAQEEDWLKRSRGILEQAPQERIPDWLRSESTPEGRAAAADIAKGSIPDVKSESGPLESAGRVLIFASFSIPISTLRALVEEASVADTVLVLRGIPKGENIQRAIGRLRALMSAEAAVPNVVIDPTLFLRYGVTSVPTLALVRENDARPVMVVGAVTVKWLRRTAAKVSPGSENLGRRAEAYDIAEPDFVLEMQARLASIDWQAKRDAAVAKFWSQHHDFVQLPDARVRREFLVDPSVEVTQDMTDAEGNTLVRAGDRWNPLNWTVLSKTIIVFRGTDPRQVATAEEEAHRAQSNGHGVILLTTAVDTAHGWEHLNELETKLSGTVYLLPDSLVERFHLQSLPATVVSHGKQLLVTELPVGAEP